MYCQMGVEHIGIKRSGAGPAKSLAQMQYFILNDRIDAALCVIFWAWC